MTNERPDRSERFDRVYAATCAGFELTPDEVKALRGLKRTIFETALTKGLIEAAGDAFPPTKTRRPTFRACGCSSSCGAVSKREAALSHPGQHPGSYRGKKAP
jgi:hypothetical protein